MTNPNYKEQFDKLTRAYIANEVNPNQGCACFVGNLLNKNWDWEYGRSISFSSEEKWKTRFKITKNDGQGLISMINALHIESNNFYTPDDIIIIENCFLKTYYRNGGSSEDDLSDGSVKEDALFIAFEKTLDRLKQIHQSKGEIVDEPPVFKKRNPSPVN